MAYARAKKHYRAVQKRMEQSPQKGKGIFIPKKKKNIAIAVGVAIMSIAFLKGLLFGYILGKKN